MLDVASSGVEFVDLGGIHVEAKAGKTRRAEGPHQRQTDVAHSHDPDLDRSGLDRLLPEILSQQKPIGPAVEAGSFSSMRFGHLSSLHHESTYR